MKCNKDCFNCKYKDCICNDNADVNEIDIQNWCDADIRGKDKQYHFLYRQAHEEEIKEYHRNNPKKPIYDKRYYLKHKDEILEKDRLRYAQNKEILQEKHREYWNKNKDELNRRRREKRRLAKLEVCNG